MTTLVRVMDLHRKSSSRPEMGKARVQRNSSPKLCLEENPKSCDTVRGARGCSWEQLGSYPLEKSAE